MAGSLRPCHHPPQPNGETRTLTQLTLAAVAFAALHLLVSGTRVRDALVARLGERAYRGLFSLASAVTLGWLIWTYGRVRVPTPTTLLELRGIANVLMLVALLLVVYGLFTPGPTVVGGERLLDRPDPARGIQRITRHPFLWGVALWAVVHMVFNRELPNLLFFGTFLLVAVAGTFSIDAKRARLFGDRWRRYAAQTSNVPFAAIVQGRAKLAWRELGLVPLGVTVAVFGALVMLHARFFGVPPH